MNSTKVCPQVSSGTTPCFQGSARGHSTRKRPATREHIYTQIDIATTRPTQPSWWKQFCSPLHSKMWIKCQTFMKTWVKYIVWTKDEKLSDFVLSQIW